MRLQYASDLHLEKSPKKTYEELLKPVAPVLVFLGDICRLQDTHLHSFFEWCSERWETVLWIPGTLEIWGSGFSDVDTGVSAMRSAVSPFANVHVLFCETMGSDDGVILLGCPLWRRPCDDVMLHVTGPIWAKADPTPTEKKVFLREYLRCLKFLESEIKVTRTPIVVLSHYAPLPWLTEEEWIQPPEYATNVPELEVLLRPPVVAWLFGHCHVPTVERHTWTSATGKENTVLLTSNPRMGQDYRKDAVLRIDPRLYEFS